MYPTQPTSPNPVPSTEWVGGIDVGGYNRPLMAVRRKKVVVAMSGGVDSSVAACLLVEQGCDVIGLFMRVGAEAPSPMAPAVSSLPVMAMASGTPGIDLPASSKPHRTHQGCCSAADAADARFVAGMLNISFYALNFKKDFDRIIQYFADEYARGRTPNPCVVCNDKLKFGRLIEYADSVEADTIATGHYARIGLRDGRKCLMRGVDEAKDQSYVLFGIGSAVLDRVMFPIGDLPKSEVRKLAAKFGLPNQDKPDSVEICFVPDRDYAGVVRARRPDAFVPGEVVDQQGHVLGEHRGLAHYTVGQRRGLRIAAGKPIYVTRIDTKHNRLVVGESDELLESSLLAERAGFMVEMPTTFRAGVKIRYLHTPAPSTVHRLANDCVRVEFDHPQRAITPGQATVFYDGDTVLGGAWITGGGDAPDTD